MSDEGTVNNQIMDATTGIIALLTGQAPSQSFGMLDAVMVETLGMAMHNAVHRQQNASMVNSAAVTAACAKMLAVPFPAPPPPPTPAPPPPGSPPPVAPLPPLNPILTTTVGTLPALQNAKTGSLPASGATPPATPPTATSPTGAPATGAPATGAPAVPVDPAPPAGNSQK